MAAHGAGRSYARCHSNSSDAAFSCGAAPVPVWCTGVVGGGRCTRGLSYSLLPITPVGWVGPRMEAARFSILIFIMIAIFYLIKYAKGAILYSFAHPRVVLQPSARVGGVFQFCHDYLRRLSGIDVSVTESIL